MWMADVPEVAQTAAAGASCGGAHAGSSRRNNLNIKDIAKIEDPAWYRLQRDRGLL